MGTNREAAESPMTVLVELPTSLVSVLFLRVEFQCMTVTITFWNEKLDEAKRVTQQSNTLMRFWGVPLYPQGLSVA